MSLLRTEVDLENNLALHLYWKDEWVKTIYKPLLFKCLSQLSACREKEEFTSLLHEMECKAAKEEGIRLLARKGYFAAELKQKLLCKLLSEEAVDQAMAFFQQKGYVQDCKRAEAVVRKELEKGKGPQFISQLLKHKKVSSDELMRLKPLIAEEEQSALRRFLQKKSEKLARLDRNKLIAYLLRRGFTYDAIDSVLGRQDLVSWLKSEDALYRKDD